MPVSLWKVILHSFGRWKILPKYSLGCLYLCERLFCTALEGGKFSQSIHLNACISVKGYSAQLWKVKFSQSIHLNACISVKGYSAQLWKVKFSQSIHLNACISVKGYSAQLWKVEILPKYSLECLYLCGRLFCTALEGGNSPKVFTWIPVSLWKVILHNFGRWKFSQSIHLNACISVKGCSAQLWKVENNLSQRYKHSSEYFGRIFC